MPLNETPPSAATRAAAEARQFDSNEFVEQQIEQMPQMMDSIREVLGNILDEPIFPQAKERLLKPLKEIPPFAAKARQFDSNEFVEQQIE